MATEVISKTVWQARPGSCMSTEQFHGERQSHFNLKKARRIFWYFNLIDYHWLEGESLVDHLASYIFEKQILARRAGLNTEWDITTGLSKHGDTRVMKR